MKVGVVGLGTVGSPLFHTLKYYHNVFGFDKQKPSDSWDDIIGTDIVFVCVPTDSDVDGRLNMEIVDEVLDGLSSNGYDSVVVLKSTLRLGYIDSVIKKYNFGVVVFPEWLYEKSAFQDTVKPEMLVIGTSDNNLVDVVKDACPWYDYTMLKVVSPNEAVMVKLVANALASTKISFANQIQLICEHYSIDVKNVMDIVRTDPRCASRYLEPGRSFGGYCLPKDTMELCNAIDDSDLLKGVMSINKRFKEELNWDKS